MNNRIKRDANAPAEQTQLRLLRLACGESQTIRTIDGTYGGLIVHHQAQRSMYCRGEHCSSALHKIPSNWKGYAGVEVWDGDFKLWRPTVLEITEAMELDFRERFARAQEWIISRAVRVKGKASACSAKFVRRLDQAGLRKPFPILPVIVTVYHCDEIDLSVKNPMPGRVFLEASSGAPPLSVEQQTASHAPPTEQQWKELREVMRNGIGKEV